MAFNLEMRPQANQRKIAKEERQVSYMPQKERSKITSKCSKCKLNVCDKHSRKSSIVCLLCSE